MSEPLAVLIYRRYMDGKTVQQLAVDFGISEERIKQRLRAAAAFLERRPSLAA
jgi:DNA-directed RNA polymerase sigma subunit (sigma70/sigma32)